MATVDYGTLTYARQGEAVQSAVLRPGILTIGRRDDNDLVFKSNEVSSVHARIECDAEGCRVIDLQSTNGTFVNLTQLKPDEPYVLKDGDIIQVGPFFIRYAAPVELPPPPPTRVTPPGVAAQTQAPRPTITAFGQQSRPPIVRRLRGNLGPPRLPPERRRLLFQHSTYMNYLPPLYHDNEFLGRFLLIFESLLEPIERTVDQIHYYFDPQLAPEEVLPWLASWVDIVLNDNWTPDRHRKLISSASELYRWRGTRHGLSEYLNIYADVDPIIIEPGQELANGEETRLPPHVFKVILEVPEPDQIDRYLVETIINSQKPAHTSYILEIRQQQAIR